jgi:predicted O-methyltransferase YrrM
MSEIKGWFKPEQTEVYQNLVKNIKGGVIAEIGNYHGLSLSYIFDICRANGTTIYAIDINTQEELKENLKNWNNVDTVKTFEGDSVDISNNFEDGFFDLVFLDGCHDYDYVMREIPAWKPKVKSGGMLCGHDYSIALKGVKRAVEKNCPNFEHKHEIWMERQG